MPLKTVISNNLQMRRLFNFYGPSEEGDDGQDGRANQQRRQ